MESGNIRSTTNSNTSATSLNSTTNINNNTQDNDNNRAPRRISDAFITALTTLFGPRANALANALQENRNRPIRTVEELQTKIQEGFDSQQEGNYREALAKYEEVIQQINISLDSFPEDDPTNTRDVFLASKLDLQDRIMAIKFSLGIDLETGSNTPSLHPEEDNREQVLADYNGRASCETMVHTLGLIPAVIALFAPKSQNEDCDENRILNLTILLYVPIGVICLAFNLLMRARLNDIGNDHTKIDRDTKRLWKKDTILDRVERSMWVVTLLRLVWFNYALYLIFGNRIPKRCRTNNSTSSEINPYTAFLVMAIGGCLDLWFQLFICALLPLFCIIFSCVMIGFYREYLKRQPVGMKTKQLNKIKATKFKPGLVDAEHQTCTVCLKDFEENDSVRKLPCAGGHVFHKDCIDPWLIKNDTCPQCREHMLKTTQKKNSPQASNQQSGGSGQNEPS